MEKMIKHCTGVIVYDGSGRIFLMTSPKWEGWVIPGGRIEEGETEEDCARREIREELGIEISDIVKIGETTPQTPEFKDKSVQFHFYDYMARAVSTDVAPNHEITSYGWFSIEDALRLPMPGPMRELIGKYKREYGNG
jgi:8-oxo-dGTP diphosphatase